jgi:hypothetical protein
VVKRGQPDRLEGRTCRCFRIEVDRLAADGLLGLAGPERVAALLPGSRGAGDRYRPRQPLGKGYNPCAIASLQLDLDLADRSAAGIGFDSPAIERKLQIGFTGINREGRAIDHRLENGLQLSPQRPGRERFQGGVLCELQIGRIAGDLLFPLVAAKGAAPAFFEDLDRLR